MLRIFFSQKRINIFCPLVQLPLIIMIYYDARRYTASTHTHTLTLTKSRISATTISEDAKISPLTRAFTVCLSIAHTSHNTCICSVDTRPPVSSRACLIVPSKAQKQNHRYHQNIIRSIRHSRTSTFGTYIHTTEQLNHTILILNKHWQECHRKTALYFLQLTELLFSKCTGKKYGGPVKIYTTKLCTNKMFGTTNRR